jgi:NAD-dependent deacetylase
MDEDALLYCTQCEGLIRPDVVWFGETLPPAALEAATHAAQQADVFMSIGTRAEVYPAAGLPLLAKAHGAYVAEINIQPSAIAGKLDAVIQGKSGEVLPQLLSAVQKYPN